MLKYYSKDDKIMNFYTNMQRYYNNIKFKFKLV